MLNSEGVRALSYAVIYQAARDLKQASNENYILSKTEREIKNGGLQLYMDLVGIDVSPEEFIKKLTSNKKQEERSKNGAP